MLADNVIFVSLIIGNGTSSASSLSAIRSSFFASQVVVMKIITTAQKMNKDSLLNVEVMAVYHFHLAVNSVLSSMLPSMQHRSPESIAIIAGDME